MLKKSIKKLAVKDLRGMYEICLNREQDYQKQIKALNAALDRLISRTTDSDDPNKIADFKQDLINKVKEGRGMKCFRCGAESYQVWDICADNNVGRNVCTECDIKLNELVLMFMGFVNWKEKIEKYKETLRRK